MDPWAKSKEFWKRSTWCARLAANAFGEDTRVDLSVGILSVNRLSWFYMQLFFFFRSVVLCNFPSVRWTYCHFHINWPAPGCRWRLALQRSLCSATLGLFYLALRDRGWKWASERNKTSGGDLRAWLELLVERRIIELPPTAPLGKSAQRRVKNIN